MRIIPGYADSEHCNASAFGANKLITSTGDLLNNEEDVQKMEFSAEHMLESWCSWHEDQDLNADQSETLTWNYLDKLEELRCKSVQKHLGRPMSTVTDKEIRKHCSVVRVDTERPGEHVGYLAWGRRVLAVWTSPQSRIEGYRYILRWYYKETI